MASEPEPKTTKPNPHGLINGIRAFPMTIPDEVMRFYLEKNGVTSSGPEVGRLIALDIKRRLVEVLKKSMELKSEADADESSEGRVSLTSELLSKATSEEGRQKPKE
uniref:COMPASS (Complex proteins associated with Set1p) component n=1 Tax=Steinernema glaseri TaxID=37863 RepID=A0A1I7ZCT8_9BILA